MTITTNFFAVTSAASTGTASTGTRAITNVTRGILFAAILAAGACSSDTNTDQETPVTEKFPESLTKPQDENLTAVAPVRSRLTPTVQVAKPVEPEIEKFSEFMARGRTRMGQGEGENALADYLRAVELRPQSQRAQIQLARTLLMIDRGTDAREPIEAALELDGASSLAWNTMGRVELYEGDNDAAIASFERATEEDSDNSYAWNNLGFVLIEEGEYEGAVAALEEATTGGFPKSYMWNNLGMAYEHLDQISLARAAYRQASEEGSARALANFDRLEGVVSLLVAEVDELEPTEEFLELRADTDLERYTLDGAVEVAEVSEP